jgi:hypothetical protein
MLLASQASAACPSYGSSMIVSVLEHERRDFDFLVHELEM